MCAPSNTKSSRDFERATATILLAALSSQWTGHGMGGAGAGVGFSSIPHLERITRSSPFSSLLSQVELGQEKEWAGRDGRWVGMGGWQTSKWRTTKTT